MNRFGFAILGVAMLFGCSDDNNNPDSPTTTIDAPRTVDGSTSTADAGAPADASVAVTFNVTMTAAAEPTQPACAAGAGATGTAMVTVSADNSTITVSGTYANLSGTVNAGHIHFGGPQDAGPVVIPFTGVANGTFSGTFTSSAYTNAGMGTPPAPATFAAFVTQLKMGGKGYVNLHTTACPLGEIRAELE
jgi:CHRD domain